MGNIEMWNIVLLLRDILLIAVETLAIVLCVVIIGSVILCLIDEIKWAIKGTKDESGKGDKE